MAHLNEDLNFEVKLSDEEQMKKKQQNKRNQTLGTQDGIPKQQAFQVGKSDYDLSAAAHPVACIFTFAFKLTAFLIYFFGGIFFSSIIVFIVVVLLSALDFWTVKNVTGRLLVGLRWWSDYDKQGKQIWKFESYDRQFVTNGVDKTFFWSSQIIFTLLWAVFLVIKILGFSFYWALLVFINLSLCFTNSYGYYKCNKQYSQKLNALKSQGIVHFAGKIF